MIIQKVRLEPFGGFNRRTHSLKPGLNVVLGDNEAGKSTMVNAIHAALFIPPDVRSDSPDWKDLLSLYFPYPDGDTIRVVLEFVEHEEEEVVHRLQRSWGEEKESTLVLSSGEEISGLSQVQEKLEEVMQHGRGTYEAVLMARQDEILHTLEKLRQEKETLSTLADMLREVVFQSGGVSVDELEEQLLGRKKQLEDNWDFSSGAPLVERESDNPDQQDIGLILSEYYRINRLERQLEKAREAEDRLESAVNVLQEKEAEFREIEEKETKMREIEEDVHRRSALEPRLEAYSSRQRELKALIREWPRKEERLSHLEEEKQEKEEEKKLLQEELESVERLEEINRKREVFERARQLKNEIEAKKEKLESFPGLTREKMEEIEAKEKELVGLKAELGGMKLQVNINCHQPSRLSVVSGLQEEEIREVEGDTLIEADGYLAVEGPDWSLKVQSGEKDVEQLLRRVEQLDEDIKKELEETGLDDVEKAREVRNQVKGMEEEVRFLEERLEDILEGQSYDELEKEIKETGEEEEIRDLAEVREAMGRVELSLEKIDEEVNQIKEQIKEWQEEYGEYDDVLEAMADARNEGNKIEEELNNFSPIPEEYGDAETFLEELKKVRKTKDALQEELSVYREEKVKAETEMPQESPEELEGALEEARRRLLHFQEEAEALHVVEEEFYSLKDELDAETFRPMQETFQEYLFPLTGYRYQLAQMDGPLPEGISSGAESEALPTNLLSYGTLSGVALALRLAMARYLLRESRGFIVMDDPLVDLDPKRKKQAAELLYQFSSEKQVIVTTCDPATAALLGGHIIRV